MRTTRSRRQFPQPLLAAAVFIPTGLVIVAILLVLLIAGLPTPAAAEDDICKTWVREHCMAKAEYIRLYLDPSVSAEKLDRRLYDMLQLESYLLSCNLPEQRRRRSLVGWRLIDKSADSFGQAVLASAYAEAGLELHPRSVFGSEQYLLDE